MKDKEEIQELDRAAQYEQKALDDFRRVLRYAKKEPALVLTALYFFLTFAGLMHLFALLDKFNVNVLPHLELTDFLLGAVYFPRMFLYYGGLVILILSLFVVERWSRNKFRAYRRYSNTHYKSLYSSSLSTMILLLAVMYLWVAVKIEATNNFKQVINSQNAVFNLHFTDPTRIGGEISKQLNDVQVIANLSKHLWVFDAAKRQVYMLPHDSVVALEALVDVDKAEDSDE